ncbi:MAG: amidohydrolase [Bacteroidetes bacterium HGW-Bacteroidetes-15]|nr:MAG: amidohydrolase [Bacteroidetes bacterium HGW-Bacteroidetes-15]
MDELIRLRHELHRNPELSGHERATGKRLRFFLNKYKPDELYTGIAGEGMAAVYNGSEPGPTLLFRCDLDALPIHETIRRSYSSTSPGVSHVCGHDGHMAIVSGLAPVLTNDPIKKGRVILFYQPEEENGKGASKSIERLKELNLYPDFAFAIHNMPKYPLGSLILGEHTFASASKGLILKLIGKDSHAAYPEKGINPSLAISEIIQGLNQLTQQKFFSKFVLLTIIHIRVGEIAFGTSPGYGEIMVTLRSFANTDMEILSQKAIELSRSIGIKHGLMVETSITDSYPAAVCDHDLTDLMKSIAKEQNREILVLKEPNRWSEDFSHFTLNGPAIILGLGVGENVPELHSPDYDFPDEAIEHGINLLREVINRFQK